MNELMEFFSTYRIDWIQASLLGLGVAGASGLAIKKVMGRKKKHWSETTHSENQNIVPFSVPHATNYDSMVTDEVNNFLMPKVAIDNPKDDDDRPEEDFTLEKPSVHSAVDISPEYHPPVTDFVPPDLSEYEKQPELMIDVPPVQEIKKENSNEFNFLDSFDESSKLPAIVPLPYILSRPSAEENVVNDFPTLTKEDAAPKVVEKTLDPSFNLELPSLTMLYPPAAPKVEKSSDIVFDSSQEPLELTRAYKSEPVEAPSNVPVVEQDNLEVPAVKSMSTDNATNEIILVSEVAPILVEEAVLIEKLEPVVVTQPQYYMGIPTLTEVVTYPVIQVEAPVISESVEVKEEKFVPTVKPEIDEEKFEFTKKYHALIEEALYFDAQNNKESAMSSLVEAGKLIENIRVNFYLKIAMQSYKNAVASNALPSIINQFYIIEKEKLMKEEAQKKQDADIAALKERNLSPNQAIKEFRETNRVSLGEAKETVMSHPAWTAEAQAGDNLHTQLLEVINEPVASEPVVEAFVQVVPEVLVESALPEAVPASPWEQGYVLFTSPEGELVALKPQEEQSVDAVERPTDFMMPLSRPVTPWAKGAVLFLGEDGKLMPYQSDAENVQSNIEEVTQSSVEVVEHAVEDVKAIVEESNPPLPETNEPTIEEVQIESVEDVGVQDSVQDVVITAFEELPASESVNSEDPSVDETQALQLHQEPISFVENETPILEGDVKESSSEVVGIEETVVAEEAFNSEPVLTEGVEPVSFDEAFIITPEEVQQEVQSEAQDLQAFIAEVESEPLEEVVADPMVLTVEENEPPVEFATFEDPVEHDASQGLLTDPELSPVAETIQQEIENRDFQEPNLNQNTMELLKPEQSVAELGMHLNKAETTQPIVETNIDFEPTQSTIEFVEPIAYSEVLPETMNNTGEFEVQPEIASVAPDNHARVISSLEQTSAWFNKPDNMQNTQEEAVVKTSQEVTAEPEVESTLSVAVEKSSIDDEFNDEETKNQFMGAFGDMFKPKATSETPNIVIPQKRKHTVWVNWMSTEGGKMNFKNDMIELNAVWGTKAAIEDLHQQLQTLVGSENQFSVVSVFEAK